MTALAKGFEIVQKQLTPTLKRFSEDQQTKLFARRCGRAMRWISGHRKA
jgi:hypothetical protein